VNNNCSESVDNVAAWSTSVFLKPIPFKMNNTIAFQLGIKETMFSHINPLSSKFSQKLQLVMK